MNIAVISQNKIMKNNIQYIARPCKQINGHIRVPGDKSISHRSIMLGSIAEGVTQVSGFLEGDDALATLEAFRAMGVQIDGPEQGKVTIHGVGLHGLKKPQKPLDLGNSGTSMRLLSGLLSGQSFDVQMSGDSSLNSRPMRRVTSPLAQMGANIESTEQGTPPLRINGDNQLTAIHYDMPVASAQVKSSILLAGLYATGKTCVTEPAPTRDHTERMLLGFGYPVERNGATACVQSGSKLTATAIDIPADISSATFFMVAAAIAKDSEIHLLHVGINETRIGIINILHLMGADIAISNEKIVGGEPVADIRVRSSQLKGIDIPPDQVPLAIDEFPAIFIAAACARGETRLRGAEELRVKESDRIQVMADGLKILGVDARPTEDGMIINGGVGFEGGEVESHGDHRIAMSFAIASLRAKAPITINNCANVATSFPGFDTLANSCGLDILVTH
jgi:3-phosphoshikimate 1-carboxyvinyltransferase